MSHNSKRSIVIGRGNGISARKKHNIRKIINKYDTIRVIIPHHVATINPSFLKEFIKPAIDKLGEAGFKRKFNFVQKRTYYHINRDLDESIDQIETENFFANKNQFLKKQTLMNLTKANYLILSAAAISLLLSVIMWFIAQDKLAAIFIGTWVPSILAAGAYFNTIKK
jgi:hypothetical protein